MNLLVLKAFSSSSSSSFSSSGFLFSFLVDFCKNLILGAVTKPSDLLFFFVKLNEKLFFY